MCDQRVPTMIEYSEGALNFQEYLVKRARSRSCADPALMASTNRGPQGCTEAIRDADRILICPSNPLISIGPILGVPGIPRKPCGRGKGVVIAVCPIVAANR